MRVTEKEFHNRCARLDPLALDLRDCRAELAELAYVSSGDAEEITRFRAELATAHTRIERLLNEVANLRFLLREASDSIVSRGGLLEWPMEEQDRLRAELVTAKEEIARLRDALERNWIHDAWCESFYGEPCNCMDAALRDGWG